MKSSIRSFFKPVGIVTIIGITIFSISLGNIKGFAQETGRVPGVTKDSILIGIIIPLTHVAFAACAHMAESIYGLANEMGGIHGRKIIPITEDDAGDPIKGVAAVKKLIHEDKVFMLHAGGDSSVCLAIKKEILKAKIPWMNMGAGAHEISTPLEKTIFTPVFTSVTMARSMVDFAMSKPGTKRVAIIKHSDDWGLSHHRPLLNHLKEKYGITPVADVTLERGVPDATPQVLQIKEANPDVILLLLYMSPISTFLRDSYKLGLKVPSIAPGTGLVDDQIRNVGLEAGENFYAPYWFKYPMDHPEVVKWEKLLQKHYPKDKLWSAAGLIMPGTLIVIEALKKAGPNLTREKFVNALESFNKFDKWSPMGYPMSVPLSFSPTNHQGMRSVPFSKIDMQAKTVKVVLKRE